MEYPPTGPNLANHKSKINTKIKNQKSTLGHIGGKTTDRQRQREKKSSWRGCEGDTLYTVNNDIATDLLFIKAMEARR